MSVHDYDRVQVQPGGRTVHFTLYKETDDPERPAAVGEVQVTFDTLASGEKGVSEIWVRSHSESLTPTDLARISWNKWLRSAETIHRTPRPEVGAPGGDSLEQRLHLDQQQWGDYTREIQAAMGRSGRRGLDENHYRRVAAMYEALVASGERAPVQRLAEQLDANYHTVSRWIRTARKKQLLPEGQPGRPG